MRLHHLEVTAFGPFADTVTVELDELSDAGLFLLTGPTGAGKSSVLDAVCFALYGDVPGDRSAARRFRCDHAAPGVGPRVVLELSVAGRRLRCTRTPAWQRPKKRGTGTTAQQASVLVEERRGDTWTALTSRMDEAGHLVAALLGMNLPQFCQVAMLPQGRFQAFLRARSEDRHTLLQQLFRTERFHDVERWLRDRARELHRESAAHQRSVAALVARTLEVAAGTLPDQWAADDLGSQASSGELVGWSSSLVERATASAEAAASAAGSAAEADAAATEALHDGRTLAERRSRYASAVAEEAALDRELPGHRSRRDELAAARRAATVPPLHRLAATARTRLDGAREQARSAAQAAAALAPTTSDALDDDRLAGTEQAVSDLLARARSLRPREESMRDLASTILVDAAREEELDRALATRAHRLAALPEVTERAAAALEDAQVAARRCDELVARLSDLDARSAAHDELVVVRGAHEEATARLQEATERCQALRERWLDLREARIQGMAAELAHALVVGASCPVCGSAEHPAKAVPSAGHPTAGAEKEARTRVDDAEAGRTALTAQQHELATRIAVLARAAGDEPPEALQAARAEADDEHDRCRALAAGRDGLAEQLASLDHEAAELRESVEKLRVERSAVTARLSERRAEHDRARDEIQTLLEGRAGTLSELLQRTQECADRLAELRRARADEAACAEAYDDAARALALAAEDAGFTHVDQALAAARTVEEVARLEERVHDHERRRQAVSELLADPDLASADATPEPDLVALARARDEASAALDAARARQDRTAVTLARLRELHDQLAGACADWAPVQRSHDVAAGVAALAAGTSTDNEWRMRLSAYVLAWRLGQVVAAANERLVAMTDQRYTLEHTGRRGAGESRGGLSLLVRDEWSGEARDPATLSGGETFVVSLALALGLADVVTREAGGVELDTLFVDEGFGALDSETLDDVMDTLDGLRDGGRVVGLVSHVAEMRSRIPVRLRVTKQRSGSGVLVERDEP